jgi:hypothetical protein
MELCMLYKFYTFSLSKTRNYYEQNIFNVPHTALNYSCTRKTTAKTTPATSTAFMQATSPIPLVPWCRTSGAPFANTNPVNTAHGRTIHNDTLLQNFILGHSTGLQEFIVTGKKSVTGSSTFFRALWICGVAFGGRVTRLLTRLPTLPLCILCMYTQG